MPIYFDGNAVGVSLVLCIFVSQVVKFNKPFFKLMLNLHHNASAACLFACKMVNLHYTMHLVSTVSKAKLSFRHMIYALHLTQYSSAIVAC